MIATQANNLQLTPLLPMTVQNPDEELDSLFSELVDEEIKKETPKKKLLKAMLDKQFCLANVSDKIQRDITISLPDMKQDIEIPFAYQNGRLQLIQPKNFDITNWLNPACRSSVEGHSLYKQKSDSYGEMKLNIVGTFQENDSEISGTVNKMLEEFDVRLYTEDQIPDLISDIQKNAK